MEPRRQVHIRKARLRDAAMVAYVARKSFKQYKKGKRIPRSAVLKRHVVRRHIQRRYKQYAVAIINNRIVGVVGYRRGKSYIVLGPIGVLPNWRKQHVGSQLLLWVERTARKRRYRAIRAEVLRGLKPLVDFYTKRGYQVSTTPRGTTVVTKRISPEAETVSNVM